MDLLLKRAVGERISIENIHCDDAWETLADPHQLENVILNLVLNASDAIAGRGQVIFEVANVVLTDADMKGRQELTCGEYVKLVIRDTGCGMTPEVKGQAFDPFFTTKEVGKGTGLGLSMAYGFVKQSGGHIEIDSELGRGTSITIYLPRSLQSQKIKPALEAVQATGGNECILVVEDDRDVQSAVVGMLERLGYQTVTADSPDEAVELLGTIPKIDLLFSDIVMPGKMSSTEFARYAIDKYPNLSVVFTSGYTRDVMVQDGGFLAGVQLLSKPYQYDDLALAIRRAISKRSIKRHQTAA